MVVGVCAVGVSGVVVGQSGVVGASRVGVAGPVVPVPPVVPGVVPIAVAPSFAKSLARPVPLPPAVDTTVQAVQGSRVVVSGLPVSVELLSAPPVGAKSVAVKVRSFDPKVLPQVGLQGVGMEFDAAGVGGSVDVRVSVDYSKLQGWYGADWSLRAQLVIVPACPVVPVPVECPAPVPVKGFVNNFETKTISGTVQLSAAGLVSGWRRALVGNGSTLGLSAGVGQFAATDLRPESSWQVSGNSGAFTYSVPFATPPAGVGVAPGVGLEYSSQSVDGMTVAANSQASVAGLGWNLSSGSGFIETRYYACNAPPTDIGFFENLCDYAPNATMSFDGMSGQLVPVVARGSSDTPPLWRLRDDPLWKIERLTGATNSDIRGAYWKVTKPDGTQIWFGQTVDSTLTGTIRSIRTWQPCWGKSYNRCKLGYRWLVSKIVDPSGNTTTFTYDKQLSYYRSQVGSNPNVYTRPGYDRAAELLSIDYGSLTSTPANKARQRVEFSYVKRCDQSKASTTDTCPAVSSSSGASYPDVPVDLFCDTLPTTCTSPSPSFFSIKRLAMITTKVLDGTGSGVYVPVAQWVLKHDFLDNGDGTNSKLWLSSIQRVQPGTSTPLLPATMFGSVLLRNREDYNTSAGVPPMNLPRVAYAFDGLGQEVKVDYFQKKGCTPRPSSWAQNDTNCFPQYGSFPGGPPGFGIYRQYLTQTVTVTDLVTNSFAGATGTGSRRVWCTPTITGRMLGALMMGRRGVTSTIG